MKLLSNSSAWTREPPAASQVAARGPRGTFKCDLAENLLQISSGNKQKICIFSFHAGIVQMSPHTDTNMPNALVKVSTHNLKLDLISDSWPVLQL